ncbi:MAG: ribonuclease H family protein [Coprobacillus sp.]
MSKYYAVKNGKQIGVFLTWEECEKQVKGFKGALYKSFPTKEQALEYIEGQKVVENITGGLIAYVDGSYNDKNKVYGYGCVLLEGQEVVQQFYGKGNDQDYVSMRNVAGEIMGSEVAIRYAIDKDYKLICIYYDYEGIEKWANKTWKANKVGTIAYQKFIEESRQKIQISFVKVLAHSGDMYNEVADKLAKRAVGIKWKE